MPRNGTGLLIAAAGVAAIFTALFAGAYFGSLYGPERKDYRAEVADRIESKNYNGPSESLPDIAGLPGLVERAIANPAPGPGQDRERRNLAAQEATALWAFWMAAISAFAVVVTTIGTILLYRQIGLTRQAVNDTRLATKAMSDANVIARQFHISEQRAYMFPTISNTFMNIVGFDHLYEQRFTWVNRGSTPAVNVRSYVGYVILNDNPSSEFDFKSRFVERHGVVISSVGPGDHVNSHIAFRLDDMIAALIRKKAVMVFSAIDYDDIFEGTERHRTEVCFRIDWAFVPVETIGEETFRHHAVGPFNGFDDQCLYAPDSRETPPSETA